MNKSFVLCALAIGASSSVAGCSSEEPADSGTSGGSGGASGSPSGGSAGSATTGGTGTGGATGGSSGVSSGGSGASNTGGTSGSATGGGSGDAGSGGASGGSAGSSSAGAGGDDPAGAGGMAGGGAGGTSSGSGGAAGGGRGGTPSGGTGSGGASSMMNFFVTSNTSTTGNLGGLAMADMRCQTLAAAVGQGSKTWRAYLSVAMPMTHAINRIGEGPYYNAAGAVVAMTKAALHTRAGDPAVFLDERGNRINGQWSGSPTPNQHDVLTGSQANGMLSTGNTCSDWTATTGNAQVGHSDGLGPNMATTGNYPIWNGSHTAPCGDLASTGGAGKLYCFVAP
jgi:hypothetical protein